MAVLVCGDPAKLVGSSRKCSIDLKSDNRDAGFSSDVEK